MNWTEGVLARHSRRKGWDKDAARQKQYFARARARIENPAFERYRKLDPADFIPGYIPSPEDTEGRGSSSSTPQRRQHTPRKRLLQNRDGIGESSRRSVNGSANLQHGNRTTESLHERMPSVDENPRETDLAKKRRRLLEKPDWVGVSLQKPIIVDRNAQDHSRNRAFRRDNEPPWRVHQIIASHQRPDFESHYSQRNMGHPDNDRMRIRVGSQDLRWSYDSNTVRSSVPSTAPRAGYHTRMAGNRGSKRPSTASHPVSGTNSRLETPLRDNNHSYNAMLGFGSERSVPSLSATSQRPSHQQRGWNELPYVVRSSPPVIHHPQPTRERPLPVFGIHSGESKDNDSTVAVAGAPKSPPNRVRSENIQWNTWLNGFLQGGLSKPPEGDEEPQLSRSMTPGISQYWDGSENTSHTSTLDHNEAPCPVDDGATNRQSSGPSNASAASTDGLDTLESELDVRDVSQERHGSSALEDRPRGHSAAIEGSQYTESGASIKPGSDLVLPTRTELPKAPNVQDLTELLVANEGNPAEHNENGQEERDPTPESDDEVWKKFVFDDDPAETSRKAREEAREQAREELCEATKHDRRLKAAEPLSDIAEPSSSFLRDLDWQAAEPPSDVAEPPSTFREKPSNPAPSFTMTEDRPEILSFASEVPVSSEPAAGADTTDANTSTAAQASSPRPPPSDFKFHQPSLFTGRLASNGPGNAQSMPSCAPPGRGRRPKSRRRRDHGRPDFRAIPDYDEDPIDD